MEINEQKRINPVKWEPKDFWEQYIGSLTPSAFLKISGVYSPYRAVEKHLRKLSTFYGIVRRNTWRETFTELLQFNYEEVYWGIIAYLKETENEWKQEWKEFWLAQDDEDPLNNDKPLKTTENPSQPTNN